jgi:NADH-quinone oxidoreductase subunit G
MPDQVKLTIDGRQITAPAGALLIEVARKNGIEIPAFCYYEGLALQAACRMCLVEVEKAPKLLAACTLPVTEGMVVRTESPQVVAARKSMLEFLLTNHPLDCPVCDKGGECELQDMVFRYGAGESRFVENKVHVDEKQWSPVVFYDAPRCILCYRCVRICDEGMGVKALGIVNRGVISEIAPSHGDHLECDECGMCIDICPVGALTSGTYRYKTRPWEMEHAGTICAHCADGCKTTLGVRDNDIVRGNNRDRSGINNEFLCIKGRYAFDFVRHPDRLQTPLIKVNGKFEEVSWSRALLTVAEKFKEIKARGGKFGVIGSNHTTNEENFYLEKLARQGLGTTNVDHHRTGDIDTLVDALSGQANQTLASFADLYTAKAVLIVGGDLAQQHPLLHFRIRENARHHNAHIYAVSQGPVREDKISLRSIRAEAGAELPALEALRDALKSAGDLVIVFGDTVKGQAVRDLVGFGESLGIPVKYVCLLDAANSRGAADMSRRRDRGITVKQMLAAPDLDALWVIGANPLKNGAQLAAAAFVVVQDMFLTETAQRADVVLPAASAYEKSGTVTNVTGEVQRLRQAIKVMGTKPDLEIFTLIAREMGVDVGRSQPDAIFEEIRRTVHGYNVALPVIRTGGAAATAALDGRVAPLTPTAEISSARDTLFTSGSLGRYSKTLGSVLERSVKLYQAPSPNLINQYPD